jgi:hypothetical protein
MCSRRFLPLVLCSVALLVAVGAVAPAAASPAPVSACPPCDEGFVRAAAAHDLDTEVSHSEATVRVHENGSATWTARVVPANESVLNRLAENPSLGRRVAADSFGTRYGSAMEHELLGADVVDGAFVVRYRTLDVVREGPLGTRTLTYFRDEPGAYIYTDLGADELTVVAPPGTTVARGFGDVDGRRLTATEFPHTRDGPFVVFAPEGSPTPGLLGTLAVASALGGVVARNVLLFAAVPGGVLVGGVAAIRRFVDASTRRNPARLGTVVAVAGAALFAGTVVTEADALPAMTGNLLIGGGSGAVLLTLGVAVAIPGLRRRLSGRRLAGFGVGVAAVVVLAVGRTVGTSDIHTTLALGAALFPVVVALGWVDAHALGGETLARRLFVGTAVAVFGALAALAPLSALGGGLFLLLPIALTVIAAVGVVVAVPLYLLGGAGARTALNRRDPPRPGPN